MEILNFIIGTPNELNQVQQFTLFDSVDIIETVNVQESDFEPFSFNIDWIWTTMVLMK